jgi:uncharacterized protein YcfL
MHRTPTLGRRVLSALLALLPCGAHLGGCSASNVYSTSNARPNAVDFSSKISNPFLKNQVEVTSAFVGQADGLLRVQANIRNISSSNVTYMYQFTWFDSMGLRASSNSDFWTRRELNGGALAEIVGLAPSSKVVDWRLEIRPWNR